MSRLLVFAVSFAVAIAITACSFNKQTPTPESSNQSAQSAAKESPPKPEGTPVVPATQPGELQPGQASGTYKVNGEVIELKYSYAGRAVRFGTESLVVLLTEKPIPADALAEEIKSAALLEGKEIRGLEYVIDENSMWVRYHPGQYQESSSNKLKEYKVENGTVSGIDENNGELTEGRHARSVKFVATIAK